MPGMIAAVVCFVSLAAVAGACWLVLPLLRARNKRLLAARMFGTSCDASGTIGFSLLCSGVRRLSQIENLLSSEYVRSEVVVVADASLRRAFFESLIARYRMIRVEYLPSDEFPVQHVRSMWRSRRRCFRRLVLLDRSEDTSADDWNAAASVASYDWLIPVRDGQYLLPGVLERLSVEAGQGHPGAVGALRSWVGGSFVLLSRDAVAAAGGFGPGFLRKIPRHARRWLWEPFFYRPEFRRGSSRWRFLGVAALGCAIFAALWYGWWVLAALLLAGAVVLCAVACAGLLLADMAGRKVPCKIDVKNFTEW